MRGPLDLLPPYYHEIQILLPYRPCDGTALIGDYADCELGKFEMQSILAGYLCGEEGISVEKTYLCGKDTIVGGPVDLNLYRLACWAIISWHLLTSLLIFGPTPHPQPLSPSHPTS
jgi:hypothetical protein